MTKAKHYVASVLGLLIALCMFVPLTLTPARAYAENTTGGGQSFSADKTYALISTTTGKAVNVTALGWQNKITASGAVTKTGKVDASSVFSFRDSTTSGVTLQPNETLVEWLYTTGNQSYFVRSEPANTAAEKYIYADDDANRRPTSTDASVIQDASYVFAKQTDDTVTIKELGGTPNRYLTISTDGTIGKSENASDAARFTVKESPETIKPEDSMVTIENVATKKLVSFDNFQVAEDKNKAKDYSPYAPHGAKAFSQIPVTGDVSSPTDGDRFTVGYGTNATGLPKVVAFRPAKYPGLRIASDYYDLSTNKTVAKVGALNQDGNDGWESVAVAPAGNGMVYLKDAALGQYVTVNDKDYLEAGKTFADGQQPTDREKFIIHSSAPITADNIKLQSDPTAVTNNSVKLSWTNPNVLYTDAYLYQKTDGGNYQMVKSLINDVSTVKDGKYHEAFEPMSEYTVTGLAKGTNYTFKIVFVNGNGTAPDTEKLAAGTDVDNPLVESNEVNVTTLNGEKPATPANVAFKPSKDGNTATISWDASANATNYRVLEGRSRFDKGGFNTPTTIANGGLNEVSNTDKRSVTVTIPSDKNKYAHYYKVVAVNKLSDGHEVTSEPSEAVSLETTMFGKNTLIFAETDDPAQIDKTLADVFAKTNDYENDAQFKGPHYQVYFKKGDYSNNIAPTRLGFYTELNGLGKLPTDTKISNISFPAYLINSNATCNFWRAATNIAVMNTQKGADFRSPYMNWAVAQAAPMRRVYSERPVAYDWNGWASGGYVADSKFVGKDSGGNGAGTWPGQQFYTRNSDIIGNVYGTTLNNFFQGVKAPNLPNNAASAKKFGFDSLKGVSGYSNWGRGKDNGAQRPTQQVFTSVNATPRVSEKPFLYLDDNGEYQVFKPSMKENTSGTSWDEKTQEMGDGTSEQLNEKFYIAKPSDSASTINQQLASGKSIYFTPGVYHAEVPIHVTKPNTLLLGSGMATIIPDNGESAVKVDDVDGVKLAGLIFDAGKDSEYLLEVGTKGQHKSHATPIELQDLFFRIGGTTQETTSADNGVIINSDDTVIDHFWVWRADHGTGVKWKGNPAQYGLIVNGNNVNAYALFDEHFEKYDVLWNGENGATYFLQNEKCYDPISQKEWMSHGGTVKGYAAYKVGPNVKKHYAVGLGVYNVFIYTGDVTPSTNPDVPTPKTTVPIEMENAIEVPNAPGVTVENACTQTFADSDGAIEKFNHIINGVGGDVSSGKDGHGAVGEGWSRKFITYYNNGNATVGKNTVLRPGVAGFVDGNDAKDDRGKFLGLETIKDVKAPDAADSTLKSLTVGGQLVDLAAAATEAGAVVTVADTDTVALKDILAVPTWDSSQVNVTLSGKVATILVTAEDGTMKTYKVTIKSAPKQPTQPGNNQPGGQQPGGQTGGQTQPGNPTGNPAGKPSGKPVADKSGKSGALSNTGSTVMSIAAVAVLAVVAGGVMVALRRRRD